MTLAMISGAALFLTLIVFADLARVETWRLDISPRPLLPWVRRHWSIHFKVYRNIDYGRPTILALGISARYFRHIQFEVGARTFRVGAR
jgi:hypothetical protein